MWLESAPLKPQCRSFFWKSAESSNLNLFATRSRLQRNLAAFALRFREIAEILRVLVGERTEKPASGRAALNPDKASQACPARIDLQPKGEHEGIVIGCFDGVVYSRGLGLSGTTDEEPIDGTFLPE